MNGQQTPASRTSKPTLERKQIPLAWQWKKSREETVPGAPDTPLATSVPGVRLLLLLAPGTSGLSSGNRSLVLAVAVG